MFRLINCHRVADFKNKNNQQLWENFVIRNSLNIFISKSDHLLIIIRRLKYVADLDK
jgi:hypothetical protein